MSQTTCSNTLSVCVMYSMAGQFQVKPHAAWNAMEYGFLKQNAKYNNKILHHRQSVDA